MFDLAQRPYLDTNRAREKDRYENTSEWGENPIAGRKCALHDMNFLRGGEWNEGKSPPADFLP